MKPVPAFRDRGAELEWIGGRWSPDMGLFMIDRWTDAIEQNDIEP